MGDMTASPASYLTRRQRSYATQTSHNNPHSLALFSAALVPSHERGSRQPSLGGGGRNRRRGSPFAALSEAYKPPRAAGFAPRGGRDRGEVLGLRSSNFSWPSVERLPGDPRHLQKQVVSPAGDAEVASGVKKPALLLLRKQTDENAVESRWVSSSSTAAAAAAAAAVMAAAAAAASGIMRGDANFSDDDDDDDTSDVPEEGVTAVTAAAAAAVYEEGMDLRIPGEVQTTSMEEDGSSRSPCPHRRSVSWGENVVHEFAINDDQTQGDVYSPDLLSLEIAKRLAVLARDAELRRAAIAVEQCRRYAAHMVRSLTAKQNGGVHGVEDACRLSNWREASFMREVDELVRCIVVTGGQKEVWRLKAIYRTARRQMEDNRSE